MRAGVQTVSRASVTVDGEVVGAITDGLLVLVGMTHDDTPAIAETMARKVHELRILDDEASAADVGAPVLVVSQFTLYGDARKGKRPSFDEAAPPQVGRELYEYFVRKIREAGVACETGRFQAMMQVELLKDGPVTILVDSKRVF